MAHALPVASFTTTAAEKYVPEPKNQRQGIGLCLSGGGYRATLFHLGALRRLNELGVLSDSRLRTISSVSGGSITAAHLATAVEWPLTAPVPDWDARVAEPLRAFTRRNIRTLPVLKRFLPWNWLRESTGVEALAAAYERHLTPRMLPTLPERPAFVLCATDMAFGANWEFQKASMGDYQVGYVESPANWPLARAVAASACFPPVFNPLPIQKTVGRFTGGKCEREDPETWRAALEDLRLTDGGNYDNMGTEPVWKNHAIVLVSDAGGLFNFSSDRDFIWRVQRYQAIQEAQARALRRRWLISNFLNNVMDGAYWGIGTAPGRYSPGAVGYSKLFAKQIIATIRTDLDAFSDAEAAILQNHGYLLADTAVRTHVPEFSVNAPPPKPPFEEWLTPQKSEDELRAMLAESGKRKKLGRWYVGSRLASLI